MKEVPEIRDLLGRVVSVDDVVAVCERNRMMVCTITKVCRKQVRVKELLTKTTWHGDDDMLKFGNQVLLVGGPDLTMWILKSA